MYFWETYINKPYNEGLKENCKILDKINLIQYCKPGYKIHDIMYIIESLYNNTDIVKNDICQNSIFNWFSEEEFIEYLKNRYPNLKIKEFNITYYEVE